MEVKEESSPSKSPFKFLKKLKSSSTLSQVSKDDDNKSIESFGFKEV